jgi:hypothetical protein
MDSDGMRQIGTLLGFAALPIVVVYFVLFQRAFASLDELERERFVKDGALPRWRRMLALAPYPIVVFVDDGWVRTFAIVWVAVQLFLDSRENHRRLANAGFTPAFISRLSRISMLSGAATLAFLTGIALRGGFLG